MASNWTSNPECSSGLASGNGAASISCLIPLFKNILTAVVAFAGIVLFIMLVIGGFTFLFSGGDQKQLEKAKGTITSAVVGLILLISAYVILLLIGTFTGVDVSVFKINIQ